MLILLLARLKLIWSYQELSLTKDRVIGSLLKSYRLEIPLGRRKLLIIATHRPVDSHNFVAPVEVAKVVEKSLENLKWSVEFIMKVIQEEGH